MMRRASRKVCRDALSAIGDAVAKSDPNAFIMAQEAFRLTPADGELRPIKPGDRRCAACLGGRCHHLRLWVGLYLARSCVRPLTKMTIRLRAPGGGGGESGDGGAFN